MNDLYYLSFDEQNSGGKTQFRQQQLDKSNLTKYDADKKGRFLHTNHFIYILVMKINHNGLNEIVKCLIVISIFRFLFGLP